MSESTYLVKRHPRKIANKTLESTQRNLRYQSRFKAHNICMIKENARARKVHAWGIRKYG